MKYNKKFKWAGWYLIVVIFFSFIYFGYWWVKPDSFIVNSELNIKPFEGINHFLWDENPEYTVYSYTSLSSLKKRYDDMFSDIDKAEKRILDVERRFDEIDNEYDKLSVRRNSEVDENFADYDERLLKPYLDIEAKLSSELDNVKLTAPQSVENDTDIEKIKDIGSKEVALAYARLETAKQATRNAQFLLDNVTVFFSQETIDSYNDLNNERQGLYQERYELEARQSEARLAVIDAYRMNIQEARDKVKLVDFIFFSVGISTTTTFGDLIANDRVVKAIITLQLLLCLIIVGGFLNAVHKSHTSA
ncbi:hypothetical protein AB6E22_06925 [Vibrio cyclitrophicus]|uniref:hypothetical protein n=1 Tax=Vibrio TaxID=662 RepID=UPI00187FDC6A|nr:MULTISPECIES: hypothetical protein [Vibrio]MBE8607678.1 hypothetical protein [Vibrio sp. OPT10]UPR28350.1 hypothetical protein IS519_08890 [Vibrio crassostreae]CAH6912737.1 conserved membrane hypothetical protein [Vibrio chagasii]CAH6941121.1 conserved membrane hypothetical protein [Vibrio chagasii]